MIQIYNKFDTSVSNVSETSLLDDKLSSLQVIDVNFLRYIR